MSKGNKVELEEFRSLVYEIATEEEIFVCPECGFTAPTRNYNTRSYNRIRCENCPEFMHVHTTIDRDVLLESLEEYDQNSTEVDN